MKSFRLFAYIIHRHIAAKLWDFEASYGYLLVKFGVLVRIREAKKTKT